MVGGNLGGGRYADRVLMPMLYVPLGALVVVLALFSFTAHDKVAAAGRRMARPRWPRP